MHATLVVTVVVDDAGHDGSGDAEFCSRVT